MTLDSQNQNDYVIITATQLSLSHMQFQASSAPLAALGRWEHSRQGHWFVHILQIENVNSHGNMQ